MGIAVICDATHANIATLPKGYRAGYVTGTPDIQWTDEDWKNNPFAVRFDQSPLKTVWDATADIDDCERGAVPLTELAGRAKLRIHAFENAVRPGQRSPLVYVSASGITNVVNALIAGGIKSGVGLSVANWNLTEPEAIAQVMAASGPFPIHMVQFHNAGTYDMSVVDTAWLNNVSKVHVPTPPQTVFKGTATFTADVT